MKIVGVVFGVLAIMCMSLGVAYYTGKSVKFNSDCKLLGGEIKSNKCEFKK